ncbi:hypothetical protein PUNSTDRAFT_67499 [Punctularia strigosozonata HHB-11173 SS5]|uniref:uncharacterized protein n=1 Tax=Punctularia strigosozonata (strain HHB-11173) TaxID=741275 RepID=UPI0004417E24|nr:uncharacterized protein PUNSTDRAFT_67499 [Punctularia strigosozonata HHB-11173 SS5]EIN08813.1 hypothetical protein PUNSTDRAFT_67499 [Punctularia strigosozonata HHB-11173 SS5]
MCNCGDTVSCCLPPSFSTRTSETGPSKLLGFADKIYVVSLPRRPDRRQQIERLSVALDFTFEYLDAVELDPFATESMLDRIMDQRVITQRNGSTFAWPKDADDVARGLAPLGLDGADLWRKHIREPRLNTTTGKYAPLTCSTENNAVIPWTPELPDYKLLTPGKLSCWYSHLLAIRSVANAVQSADHPTMLDDVDMEHDIHQTIKMLWPSLPASWDIVFLGHCWSNETSNPPLPVYSPCFRSSRWLKPPFALPFTSDDQHHRLHPSHAPKCTHAYALSRTGARRLWAHLRYAPFAYSRALDQAIAWLVSSGRLSAFSVVPSLVVQMKIGASDVAQGRDGRGSEWREELQHGVLTGKEQQP